MAKREIYTQRLRAGKRIYYFDICESSGEQLYIKVSERKRTGANSQEHHRLIVYPEDLEDFCDELNDLVDEFRDRFNGGAELGRREQLEADGDPGPGYSGGDAGADDSDGRGHRNGERRPASPAPRADYGEAEGSTARRRYDDDDDDDRG